MNNNALKSSAEILGKSRINHLQLASIPSNLRPKDEIEAYFIQEYLHNYLLEKQFGKVVGKKIGCTTKVMQKYLRISNPCVGGVYDINVFESYGKYFFDNFISPGVECEIAVFLEKDLPPNGAPYTRSSVEHAVSSVMASIEIVDDRWKDYKSIDTPSLIADDFFGSGCVLGPPISKNNLDLSNIEGRMFIDEELVGVGFGKDIMGHPLEALAWLANFMSDRGKILKSNQFVSLGSIIQTKWINPGNIVSIEIEGLGSAIADFSR